MKFTSSIRTNSRKVLVKVNKTVYSLASKLFTNVVEFTPSPFNPGDTATGLLANQWYPSVGSPSSALGKDTSPNGADSLARIRAMTTGREFLGKDGKLYLTNNVHYAYRAEVIGWRKEDGWSGLIGPYAMVSKAMFLAGNQARIKI